MCVLLWMVLAICIQGNICVYAIVLVCMYVVMAHAFEGVYVYMHVVLCMYMQTHTHMHAYTDAHMCVAVKNGQRSKRSTCVCTCV